MKSAVFAAAILLLAYDASACIVSGTGSNIQAALDAGTDAVLCINSSFSIYSTINYRFPNTQIYTEGSPVDSSRAVLHIASSSITTAISASGVSGAQLRSVIVDGARPTFGYVRTVGGTALVEFGGDASDQIISYVEAYEPREWSTIHVVEGNKSWNGSAWVGGCSGAQVTHNNVHNAGYLGGSKWADGISYACHDGYIGYNTVTDATDGGIILFGAPNTIIEYNTVTNYYASGFAGIAFDTQVYLRTVTINGVPTQVNDSSGAIVRNNTVNSGNYFGNVARTQIGIAMGPRVWWSNCPLPSNEATVLFGATVINNTLSGYNFGFGYAVDGVDSLTATGNVVVDGATHWTGGGSDCGVANQYPGNLFNVHSIHTTNSTIQTTIPRTGLGGGDFPVLEGQVHHIPNTAAY
jgi:hypothetical protein